MDDEVLDYLIRRDNATDAVRIKTYSVYLGNREVIVNVRDTGGGGLYRYQAEAYFADIDPRNRNHGVAGYSLGNVDHSIQGALDNIHWWELETIARQG